MYEWEDIYVYLCNYNMVSYRQNCEPPIMAESWFAQT